MINTVKNKIMGWVCIIIALVSAILVWGVFLFGGPLQQESIDSPKFIRTADNQFYYIKEASWLKTLFLGGIILPSQVQLVENSTELPSTVEVLWPDHDPINNVNQVIVTFKVSDQSDPRQNGRQYKLLWRRKPGMIPLIISLMMLLVILNSLSVYFWKRSPLTQFEDKFVPDPFQRAFLTGLAIFILNLFVFTIVFIIISIFVKNHVDQSVVDSQIMPPYRFKPEQIERTQYMAGLLIFPIVSFFGWYLLKNLKVFSERTISILFPITSLETVVGLGVVLFYALQRNAAFYIQSVELFRLPWIVIGVYLLMFLVTFLEYKHPSKGLTVFLKLCMRASLLAAFIFIFFTSFVTESDPYLYSLTPHFSAYMYSIDQVFKGKTILVDITNQYGFYPYLLEPILKIIGMGIPQLTILVSAGMVLFFAAILFLASRLIKSQYVFICAIWVIPGNRLWEAFTTNYESYYQYWPHRVLFPGLLLLMIWLYQQTSGKLKKAVYWATYFLCCISLLWNFDTGFIVLLGWGIFLGWEALGGWHLLGFKKTALTLIFAFVNMIIVSILSFGLIYYYTFFRSGHYPNLADYFYYQSFFYGAGFGMLPMPDTFHMWNFVLLTYAIGLYLAISRLCKKLSDRTQPVDRQADVRNNMIFIVSIMGAGLFSYYQGRSHDANLNVTFWTAWFLLVLFADEVFQHFFTSFRKSSTVPAMASNIGNGLLMIFLSFMLFSYTGGVVSLSPVWVDRVQFDLSNVMKLRQGAAIPHAVDITLINKYFKPGEDVLIIAYVDQAYLYIESGTKNPLNIPSFSELFTRTDYQKVFTYLAENKDTKVVMSKEFDSDFPDLYQQVFQEYRVVEQNQDLIVLARK